KADGFYFVAVMNPGEPLLATADWPTGKKAKRQQHFRQSAPLQIEHHAATNDRLQHPHDLHRRRRGFPGLADLAQKIVAGTMLLGNYLIIIMYPIIILPRRLDDNFRFGAGRADSLYHRFTRIDPAL